VFPGSFESLLEQLLEVRPARAVESTHDVHIIERKLERRSLEAHISAWRVGEHEPKVDVNEVTVSVDEDVTVVPVFDLKEVRDDRIACRDQPSTTSINTLRATDQQGI
jgi:acyl-CoA hydrolase